jgi:hypothetical protein
VAWNSSTAWTTLLLTLYGDGRKDGWLLGASPFPQHAVYDEEGQLVGETSHTDFGSWFSRFYGSATPWGGRELEPLALQEMLPDSEKAVA